MAVLGVLLGACSDDAAPRLT